MNLGSWLGTPPKNIYDMTNYLDLLVMLSPPEVKWDWLHRCSQVAIIYYRRHHHHHDYYDIIWMSIYLDRNKVSKPNYERKYVNDKPTRRKFYCSPKNK